MLAANEANSTQRYARFQKREEVGIITFSDVPARTRVFPMGSTAEENSKTRAAITQFINGLQAAGATAIYSSMQQALQELAQERSANKETRYYTVVLMTDGENNAGRGPDDFSRLYDSLPPAGKQIPTFTILYGSASAKALEQIAAETHGKVFDARNADLSAVFKEIRGYQ